jgi:hypothetical protein
MSTITVQNIFDRATFLLNDTANVRWTTPELLDWITDGQREAALNAPLLYTVVAVVALAAGARQSTAALTDYNLLVDIKRNVGVDGVTPGDSITPAAADVLNMLDPGWQYGTPVASVEHFTFDKATRYIYQVYPPAILGTKVELTYSAIPPVVSSTATTIVLPDLLSNALVDYICYRALSKDAEFADVGDKAAAHYKLFTDAVAKEAL